jgi:hypothetical protein
MYVCVILPVSSVCFAAIRVELNKIKLQNFLPNIEIIATNAVVASWAVKYTCVLKCMSHIRSWKEQKNMIYRKHNLSIALLSLHLKTPLAVLCIDIRDSGKGCQSVRPTVQNLHCTGQMVLQALMTALRKEIKWQ